MSSAMGRVSDWNRNAIEEFRANASRVGANFTGAPLLVTHTTGARSGQGWIDPLMYQHRRRASRGLRV